MSGKKDEIGAIREKLLDRIDELNNRTHRYNRTFNWHYEVKEIINELFGVEWIIWWLKSVVNVVKRKRKQMKYPLYKNWLEALFYILVKNLIIRIRWNDWPRKKKRLDKEVILKKVLNLRLKIKI